MNDLQPLVSYEGGTERIPSRVVAELRGYRGYGKTESEAVANLTDVLLAAEAAQRLRPGIPVHPALLRKVEAALRIVAQKHPDTRLGNDDAEHLAGELAAALRRGGA